VDSRNKISRSILFLCETALDAIDYLSLLVRLRKPIRRECERRVC
jgi:hypothetical protein